MAELANVWQLSEQIRHRVALACDAQSIARRLPGMGRVSQRIHRRVLQRSIVAERRGDGSVGLNRQALRAAVAGG